MEADGVVEFLLNAGKLKMTMRRGWVLRNVTDIKHFESTNCNKPRVESVADHSWRIGLMTTLIQDKSLDKGKMCQMGLIHDIAECITGDFTPVCNVSKEEKVKLEKEALTSLVKTLPNENNISSLWNEYEDRITKESQTVKDLDLIEMVLQAFEYELASPEKNLQEFFDSIENKIKHPEVISWEKSLRKRRSLFKSTL